MCCSLVMYIFVSLLSISHCVLSFNYAEDCGEKIVPPNRFVATSANKTKIFHAPWAALIQRNDSGNYVNHCTGVIVTQNHLVSAAHCFASIAKGIHDKGEFRIVMGIDDLSHIHLATIRNILDVKIMPEYNEPAYYYDMAVLRFSTIDFNVNARSRKIWPICLPETANDNTADERRVGHLTTVTAWGKQREGDVATSRFLLSADLVILPNFKCYDEPSRARPELRDQARNALPRGFDPSLMCALGKGEGICEGDSGGPLYIEKHQRNEKSKFYLIGIVTGVIDGSCASKFFTDIFNRVEHSKTLNWIKCTVGLESCSSGKNSQSLSDLYFVVATGRPLEESRMTEVINWSQNKSCSINDIEKFPTKLAYAAGGVLEGKPTICGGLDENDNKRNDCWQQINSKWMPTSYSLNTKRSSHAALTISNNRIIITGGYDDNQRLSSTEILKGNKFEYGPALQVALFGHCAVTFNSNIWIIGGNTNNGRTDQTWIHSKELAFLKEGPLMTRKRYRHGCATMNINNKESIIVVGGIRTDNAEYLDSTTSSWKRIKKELPRDMGSPVVLTTTLDLDQDMNAVIVYKGKFWQIISTEEGVTFEEIIPFGSIEREYPVAFLLPSNRDLFQGC